MCISTRDLHAYCARASFFTNCAGPVQETIKNQFGSGNCCKLKTNMSASSYIASPTILTSPSGSFSYPIYPSRYRPATEVTWVIKVDKGKFINLTLHVIDVEEYRGKCIDIIEIKDGNNSQAPLLGNIFFRQWYL